MKNPSAFLKIGQAAKTLGVSIDTLRRWERVGKISVIRTPGGTRLYSLTALKKINPSSVADYQVKDLSTEELLKRVEKDQISEYDDITEIADFTSNIPSPKNFDLIPKFLIGTVALSAITLTSWLAASHLISPKKEAKPEAEVIQLPYNPNVLAVTASSKFLEVNSDTQINGPLSVRDTINDLTLEATPSASTIALTSGNTTLTITDSTTLDQDVSTTSNPTFSAITLSATTNQLTTGANIFTLPQGTTTLVGTNTTQTLTNKSISGSSNTLTNIPNSALTNAKVTVTAGTNLTGGGDVTLGSSVTLSVKGSPSFTGQVQLEDGTATAPSLTFASDTDTGLYRIDANRIGLIVAGTATSGITINASGNVGIGTITPTSTLHVAGTLGVTGATTVDTDTFFVDSSANRVGIGTTSPQLPLHVFGDGTYSATFLNGNIGIGTTAPRAALTVGSSNGVIIGLGYAASSAPTNGLAIEGNVGIGISTANSTLSVAGSAHIGGIRQGISAPANGLFVDGNVGIGATTSSNILDVWGNSRITGTLTVDSTATLGNSLIGYSGVTAPASGLAVSGNVGIGATTANSALFVNGGVSIGSNANRAAPTDGLLVWGNVGIGTTGSAAYNLDVWGSGRFTGALTVNGTLTGNGAFTLGDNGDIGSIDTSDWDISTTGAMTLIDSIANTSANLAFLTTTSGDITFTPAAATGLVNVLTGNLKVGNGTPTITQDGEDAYIEGILEVDGTTTLAGNVGIGFTTPDRLLQLAVDANPAGTNASLINTAGTTQLSLTGTAGNAQKKLVLGIDTTDNYGVIQAGNTSGTNYDLSLNPAGGNVGIGLTSPAYTLQVAGTANVTGNFTITSASDILTTGSGTDIGSSAIRFATGWFDTVDATNIAGTITGGSTTASSWTINSDNATADTEDSSLAFERGTTTPNAVLGWDSTSDEFDLNSQLHLTGTITSTNGIILDGFTNDITTVSNQHLSLMPNGTGNVGVGTTTPGATFAVVGNSTIGFGSLAVTPTGPSSGLAVSGNVGVGTTSPLQALHVVGQCVTGDTLLKRRRKNKKGEWTDEYEEIEIKDIKEGDQILSLNETTGEFEPHKVKGLMDMGKQEVFLLTTQSNLRIETTANHPYLTIEKGIKSKQVKSSTTFEIDQSPRIEDLDKDSFVALANKENRFAVRLRGGVKRKIFTKYYKQDRKLFGPEIFALLIAEAVNESNFDISKLFIDKEYAGYQRQISQIIEKFYPQISIEFKSIGHSYSPAHKLAYDLFTNKKRSGSARISKDSRLQSSFTPGLTQKIHYPHDLLITKAYHKFDDLSTHSVNSVWKQVRYLKSGDTIATVNGWAKISSIYSRGKKQTYDIEVSGTHNFVGNNIVAHNTYISGNLGIGITTPGAGLSLSSNAVIGYSGVNIAGPSSGLAVSGNVGVGTTTANNPLSVVGAASFGTYSQLTAPSNGLIVSGNTGIGTSAPQGVLDVNGTSFFRGVVTTTGNVGVGGSITGFGALSGLNVTGLSNLTGNVGVGSSLTVTSAGVFSSGIKVSAASDLAALSTTGATTLGSTLTVAGTTTLNGAFTLGDNGDIGSIDTSDWDISSTGAMTLIDSIANTSANLAFLTTTSGDITLTPAVTTGLVNVLTGNLKVGNGTPTISQDGEDAYIEGILEVDGTTTLAGNVGIGFTTPDRLTQIASDINIVGSNASLLGAAGTQFALTGSSATGLQKKLVLGLDTTDNYGVIQAGTLGTNYDLVLNPAGGNIGIGTTNPGTLFDASKSTVGGDTTIRARNEDGTNAASDAVIDTAVEGSGGDPFINFGIGGADSWSIGIDNSDSDKLKIGRGGLTISPSAATNLLTIDTTGNVGIGEGATSPTAQFHVIQTDAADSFRVDDVASDTTPFLIDASGNVGIGFTTPDRLTQIASDINIVGSNASLLGAAGTQFALTGSSATGLQKKLVLGLDTTDNYGVIQAGNISGTNYDLSLNPAGGNVGIGLTSPGYKLEVSGDARVTTTLNFGTAGAQLLGGNQGGSIELGPSNSAGGEVPFIDFHFGVGSAQDYNARIINAANNRLDFVTNSGGTVMSVSGGNVGIGDVSPDYLLELTDATNTPAFALSDDDIAHGVTTVAETDVFAHLSSISSTVGGAYLQGIADATGVALQLRGIQSSDPTDTTPAISLIGAKASGTGVADLAAAETVFQVANNDDIAALAIVGNGNIGIGTTTPATKLEIRGGTGIVTNYSNALAVVGSTTLGTTAGSYQFPAEIVNGCGNQCRLQFATYRRTAGSAWDGVAYRLQFAVDNSFTDGSKAYVEIGTDDPNAANGGFISLGTAGSDRLVVTNAGNVGIGATTPNSLLDVWGNSRITGTLTSVGQILAANGTTSATSYSFTSSKETGLYSPSANALALNTNNASTPPLTITAGGNVGIGITAPAFILHSKGTAALENVSTGTTTGSACMSSTGEIFFNTGSNACIASTLASKHDIASLDVDALTLINALQPVSFVYNEGADTRYGFIAEDTANVDPRLAEYDTTGVVSNIDDRAILSLTVKAIQQQQTQIASQSAQLASFSLDPDGNLIVPQIKVDKLLLTDDVDLSNINPDSLLVYDFGSTTNVDNTSEVKNCDYTSEVEGCQKVGVDVLSSLKNLDQAVADVKTKQATDSASLAELKDQIASLSSVIASQAKQSSTSTGEIATGSSTLRDDVASLNLTPPDILYATGSATLATSFEVSEATVSGMLTAYQAAVQDNFKVFGETTLGKTTIAGNLNVDGTLSIENGNEINVIGVANTSKVGFGSFEVGTGILYLQKSPLAQGLDIFNGKVFIDSSGNLTTQGQIVTSEVKTTKLTITSSIGSATISASQDKVTVETKEASASAKVFITPTTPTDKVLSVTNIQNKESFDVAILTPTPVDINFNWWIVQTE